MIGIAIPCYKGHVHLLPTLLENIYSSTVRPDQIAISCSSWHHSNRTNLSYKGIPVYIQYSSRVQNQATNRNIAGRMLTTKLLSFIDADDLMHPSRIEYILRAFREGPYQAIYHGYTWEHASHYADPFQSAGEYDLVSDPVVPDFSAVGIKVGNTKHELHHAHVTVRREVFNQFTFDDRRQAYRIEDSLYGRRIAENGVIIGFLANRLSRYIFTSNQ